MTDRLNQVDSNDVGTLKYQSALPVSRGKLAMLLFISTEIMFFTALIASYVVLRFSGNGEWPSSEQVHVHLWIGIVNTIVLIASCFTLHFSAKAASRDQASSAKTWLLATIALGFLFLGIKGYEYFTKFEHGLYPSANRTLIYDRADEQYLSRTMSELSAQIALLDNKPAGQRSEAEESHREKLQLVQTGVVDWTKFNVSRAGDPLMRRRSLEALAHRIYPRENNPELDQFLADELASVQSEHDAVASRLSETEKRLSESQDKLKGLLPERESGDQEIEEKYKEESKTAEELTTQITLIRGELNPLKQRLLVADLPPNGINQELGIKLPIVIPQGKAWINTYYLLTGFHAIHLLIGLFVLVCWLVLRLGSIRAHLLENFSLYWHFVDLVWLIIFAIVYLN